MEREKDIQGLIKALGYDKDLQVRVEAAKALGTIRDKNAVHPLLKALNGPDKDVRLVVVWALGKVGDERAVEPLVKALSDPNEYVRRNAAKALRNLRRM